MYVTRAEARLSQGDIFESIIYRYPKYTEDGFEIEEITFPYIIVMSQECDLDRDFINRNATEADNNDKYLQTILICPAYIGDSFRTGQHLSELGLTMLTWNSTKYSDIKSNQNERFHFIPQSIDFQLPDLLIDFKHYFTVSREEAYDIYKPKYKISIDVLFREDISHRFANYLSRIGLPE